MAEWIRGKPERKLPPRLPTGPPVPKPKPPLVLTPLEKQVIGLLLHERLEVEQIAERLNVSRWKIRRALGGLYKVLDLLGWGSPHVRLWLWAFYNPEFNPGAPPRPPDPDG